MMEFVLASGNPHKAEELNMLFGDSALKIVPATQKLEVDETGKTFQDNALLKAKAYNEFFKAPSLADDSGLVIPAREDILGVQSARFAPEFSDYKDKNRVLLEEIKDLSGDDRKAYFCCSFCFYISDSEIYYFEGRVHGKIGDGPSGAGGFGYDPVFIPDGQSGKSLAELHEWKMQNSHRAKAAQSALKFFQGYQGLNR